MKISTILVLMLLGLTSCQSQNKAEFVRQETDVKATLPENPKIEVEVHFRVDTTKDDIKEIVRLWTNYLNSKPDEISDNPYWNEEEKLRYKDFDLSRGLLYQFPSDQLLRSYKPKILTVEKEGDHYGIRTIYSADGLEGDYRNSNPLAIQKIYAVKENNQWRLKNSLPIITQNWNRKTIGKITYIYPPSHPFNGELAAKANEFCNQIGKEFQFPKWEPFDYYITQSGDELGRLLNFDFFSAGYTTGIGFNEERMLLSGFGSEYYPHEFVHLIVPPFKRHGLIEEGFATWKGGQAGKTFEESAKILANGLAQNDTATFSDVVNKTWGWQYFAYYTTGAILCHSANQKGGAKLVNALLQVPNDSDKLIDNLCLIFGVEKKDFDGFWRNETMKFRDNSIEGK